MRRFAFGFIALLLAACGQEPAGKAPAPRSAATLAYVPNSGDGTVSVISLSSGEVVAKIEVGDTPQALVATSDGRKIYVANHAGNSVSVITAATRKVATIKLPDLSEPNAVSIAPDDSKVYVCNWGAGTVSVIATASDTLIATIPVGPSPQGIAVSPDGTKLLVPCYDEDTVWVISTATNIGVAKTRVGGGPYGIVLARAP